MSHSFLSLSRLRVALAQPWLAVVFGAVYAVSQLTILLLLAPLGHGIGKLQVSGFTAETYLATFRAWEAAGVMDAYRNHFVFDDIHWVWYAGLLTVALCTLFERHQLPSRANGLLLLPVAAGLCDAYENHLQQVFLSDPDFAAIVDPLPLLSTVASLTKWSLAAACILLILALALRGRAGAS